MFYSSFTAITSLGEGRANLSAFRTFVGFVLLDLSVFSSSWCLGRSAVCDCGTPWTFLLPSFFFFFFFFALLKSIINILLYQTLQNTNQNRTRMFDIFLFIAIQVLRNFVAVRQFSVVAGTVPVVGCLDI